MKKSVEGLRSEIRNNQGTYETSTYRYIEYGNDVLRIKKEYLDTTAALMPNQSSDSKWEVVK